MIQAPCYNPWESYLIHIPLSSKTHYGYLFYIDIEYILFYIFNNYVDIILFV